MLIDLYDVDEVDAIPRRANGKFRPVISRCREQYPGVMGYLAACGG